VTNRLVGRLCVGLVLTHSLIGSAAQAQPPQLSGTVVDSSGGVIADATVQMRSADGTVVATGQSDANGSFTISGLSAGSYRLAVSHTYFETKEIPVTIGTGGPAARLRIVLSVGGLSATVNVQGREDDLGGIAQSGTRGRWAQENSKIVRFFAREKYWRRFRVSSSRSTPAVAKRTNTFCGDSISTTEQTSRCSSATCR